MKLPRFPRRMPMLTTRLSASLLAGLILSGNCLALDFKTVGNNPAIMFDAPSLKGKKMFIAPRGMPVEVVLSYGEWSKVRDASGGLAWIETKALQNKRNVVVQVANAKIRNSVDDATIAFSADKGVLLEMVDGGKANGWIKVKHKDGQSGYVKAADVWGE